MMRYHLSRTYAIPCCRCPLPQVPSFGLYVSAAEINGHCFHAPSNLYGVTYSLLHVHVWPQTAHTCPAMPHHHPQVSTHRSLAGKLLPPGVGPGTTLVITDIQVSVCTAKCICARPRARLTTASHCKPAHWQLYLLACVAQLQGGFVTRLCGCRPTCVWPQGHRPRQAAHTQFAP